MLVKLIDQYDASGATPLVWAAIGKVKTRHRTSSQSLTLLCST